MKSFSTYAAHAAALVGVTSAQSSGSATSTSAVSLATAVAGNYSGPMRPQVHFSPPVGFMNDPNGMFRDVEGVWHLYYQYNPTDIVAGNQHWGHADSKDLYHWENQPIAISPSAEGEGIFSGSAVLDPNNTSGFFPNQTNGVVAIYTLNTAREQTQELAYSSDNGYTFTKYAGNPVLSINSTQFRDPKVVWFEDHWVMVIAYAQEFTIGIFTSPNLKDWTHASNFSHHGLLGLQYECPNLVSMPFEGRDSSAWLLAVSINPGAPLGGSIMQYFPGDFNGTHFSAFDAAARIADFGKDNYAGQFFYGLGHDEDQVLIGWASNWQYCNDVPTGPLEGWRSSMTLPRRSYLKNITRVGYDLVSTPYELSSVYGSVLANSTAANGSLAVDYANVTSGAIYLHVNVSGLPTDGSAQGTLNFTFSSSSPSSSSSSSSGGVVVVEAMTNSSISAGYFFGGDSPFWIDRGGITGYENPFFTDKFSAASPINADGVFVLEAVVDRSILEVFLNGGERSATNTFFSDVELDRLTVATAGLNSNVSVAVVVRGLQSGWVGGNSTR